MNTLCMRADPWASERNYVTIMIGCSVFIHQGLPLMHGRPSMWPPLRLLLEQRKSFRSQSDAMAVSPHFTGPIKINISVYNFDSSFLFMPS